MVEPKLTREQIEDAPPSDALVVEPQEVPDDTVVVAPGVLVMADNQTVLPYEGTLASPAFGALTVANYRWDLVCIDLTTATPELAGPWSNPALKGVESVTPIEWYDGIPVVPQGYMPVAAIKITEPTGDPVLIVASDIVDVRGFFHTMQSGAQFLGYSPATPSDWISPPSMIKGGLDQLATRLNTNVIGNPLTVSLSPNDAGTSKIAARSDHLHYHGLLGNTGSIDWQHKASELGHAIQNAANWDSVATEDDIRDRLEELAQRVRSVESDFPVRKKVYVLGYRTTTGGIWNWRQPDTNGAGSGGTYSVDLLTSGWLLRRCHARYDQGRPASGTREHVCWAEMLMQWNASLGKHVSNGVSYDYDIDTGAGTGNVSNNLANFYNLTISTAYVQVGRFRGNGVQFDVKMRYNAVDNTLFDIWLDDTSNPWSGQAASVAFEFEFEQSDI